MKLSKSLFVAVLAGGLSAMVCAQAAGLLPVEGRPSSASPATAVTGTIDPVNGFQTTSSPIAHSVINDGGGRVRIATGTTAYSATITVDGRRRRYLVMRPTPANTNAPVLLLLHPFITSPETMSEVTEVADYVLTQGFWAVLPEATGGTWDQRTDSARNTDQAFISALIDSLIANDGVDASRIYASGFSDGGFMTEILACNLSEKIAAFGIDAATLRGGQALACAPSVQRPKVYFLGTADLLVAYNGILSNFPHGQQSAENTLAFWAGQQGCGGVLANTLPNRAADGTTVQQTEYTGCTSGTALQLYTIFGGGHAWPGGEPSFFGLTTRDIHATGLIWQFVSGYRR